MSRKNFDSSLKILTLLNAHTSLVDSKLTLRYLLLCKKAGKAKDMLKTIPVDWRTIKSLCSGCCSREVRAIIPWIAHMYRQSISFSIGETNKNRQAQKCFPVATSA